MRDSITNLKYTIAKLSQVANSIDLKYKNLENTTYIIKLQIKGNLQKKRTIIAEESMRDMQEYIHFFSSSKLYKD